MALGEHLDRYLAEFTFRHNRREMGEGQCVNALLGQVEGRLAYKALTNLSFTRIAWFSRKMPNARLQHVKAFNRKGIHH